MNTTKLELTPKSILLAILITITLTAANAYLGLKVGLTASASIPAAVISLAVLSLFKRSSVLESNLVQTAASTGEALVAAIAFVLPALLILKTWDHFNYFQTVSISLMGGFLGVLFSIPLRRVLIFDKDLKFPEGTAIGNVLKAHSDEKTNAKPLILGGIAGSIIAFFQTGLQVISESMYFWFSKNNVLFGYGFGFSPALVAAGYIVGATVGVSILIGTVLGWALGIPIVHSSLELIDASAFDVWQAYIRYIGVGVMLVGGIWTLIKLLAPMKNAFLELKSIRLNSNTDQSQKDLPLSAVFFGLLFTAIPLFYFLYTYLPMKLNASTLLVIFAFILFAGFLFSAICGYFAGLVGSTNNPVSAMALAALTMISLLLLILLGRQFDTENTLPAASVAIIIGTFIAAISAISGDTIQDLKAGHIIGATPWKQQIMLFIGVIVAALVIPLILELLFNAYGIAGVFPREGMDPSQMLSAPQAGLMAAVTQGVFQHDLPWNMILIGAVIAVVTILLDHILKKRNYSLSVLAVGLGIYLPLSASTPVMIGGIAAYFINRKANSAQQQQKLLLACGLVAGAAVMGVVLAIPFILLGSADALSVVTDNFERFAHAFGLLTIIALIAWLKSL